MVRIAIFGLSSPPSFFDTVFFFFPRTPTLSSNARHDRDSRFFRLFRDSPNFQSNEGPLFSLITSRFLSRPNSPFKDTEMNVDRSLCDICSALRRLPLVD